MIKPEFYKTQREFFELFEEQDAGKRFMSASEWWHRHIARIGVSFVTMPSTNELIRFEKSYWEHTRKILFNNIAEGLRSSDLAYYGMETEDKTGNTIESLYLWVVR